MSESSTVFIQSLADHAGKNDTSSGRVVVFVVSMDLEGRATLSVVPEGLQWKGQGSGSLAVETGVDDVPPSRDGSRARQVFIFGLVAVGLLTAVAGCYYHAIF